MVSVERIFVGCIFGESPYWHIRSQSLYFVDTHGKKIYKYVPAKKKITKVSLDKQPSFIIPVKNGKNEFIVSLDNELAIISWDGESESVTVKRKVARIETSVEVPKNFSAAKCDSAGRLWTGAHSLTSGDLLKSQPYGNLYSLNSKLQLKVHVDEIRYSNGLTFNDETKKMFYIDSLNQTIDRFDFDIYYGKISKRRTWFSPKEFNIPGIPHGMTIDSDGNLWVAMFGGSCIISIAGFQPETILKKINIPAFEVTSVAFGGKDLDDLYVTSGAIEFEKKVYSVPEHGATYKVTGTGSRGVPTSSFKLN